MRCLNCNRDGIDAPTVLCPKCGVHLPSLMRDMLPAGTRLHGGKYTVEHALGQGGFGITYLGRHATLKKQVAIKEFYPQEQVVREATTGQIVLKTTGRDTYERALRRFMREGETLAALDHESVVRVNDQFEEHGTAYLVMDLIDGRTLKEELDAQPGRRLPEARVREITGQLVSALDAVHSKGVCHLDIKPDNILLRRDGRAVLVDFGASKQGLGTRSTRAFTLEYAAPEVLAGDEVGPQSDLYELGVVVHELLTGERPPSALSRLTNDRWTPDAAPAQWRALLSSALRLRREERPASIRSWWNAGPHKKTPAPPKPPAPAPSHAAVAAPAPQPKPAYVAAPTPAARAAAAPPASKGRRKSPWISFFVVLTVFAAVATLLSYMVLLYHPAFNGQSTNASFVSAPRASAPVRWEGDLDPRVYWQDTGLRVTKGETLTIKATGQVTWDPKAIGGTSGPNGYGSASRLTKPWEFPVQNFGTGALVMQVGDTVYPVGSQATIKVDSSGTVKFMLNDRKDGLTDNTGSLRVTVQ